MKGIVFTEFLEMVEAQFGIVIADRIINEDQLESGGVYTSVGTYNHTEMVQLVTNLSKETELPVHDLLRAYGKHFFTMATVSYQQFFHSIEDSFQFLSGIENYIHVEVLKLYPDAELPRFEINQVSSNELIMIYHSERRLAHFAQGLIEACVDYFNELIDLEVIDMSGDGSEVKFILVKK